MVSAIMSKAAPVVLIGAARSGTKFIRDVLASASGVRCVPYDVNYVWRHGAPTESHDALDPELLTDQQINYIRQSLFKLAKLGDDDILIEKTVSNSLRVKYVDKVFPNARYVHIVRDGRDVTESAMRQWLAKPDISALLRKLSEVPIGSHKYVYWFARNFIAGALNGRGGGRVWGPRFPSIFSIAGKASLAETCALQWRESVTRADEDLRALPDSANRVAVVRYEEFVKNEAVLVSLIDFLELPDQESILNTYRATCRPPDSNRWKLLADDDQAVIERIAEAVMPIATRM